MYWLWLFCLYSFLGYLLEKIFAAVTGSRHQVRKCFLLLPLCPVYGLGMAAVLALPHIWGELGVQLAQPVSDVCAFALTVPLVLGVLRDMDRQQRLEKIR